MSGNRYLLDTNAIIFLLNGTCALGDLLARAEWIGISIISKLEFLCFDGLTDADRQGFLNFCDRVDVVDITDSDEALISVVVDLRSHHELKLPDAVIAASTLVNEAVLVTADSHFSRIVGLELMDPNEKNTE